MISTTLETLDLAERFLSTLFVLLLLTLGDKVCLAVCLWSLDALWTVPCSMVQSTTQFAQEIGFQLSQFNLNISVVGGQDRSVHL